MSSLFTLMGELQQQSQARQKLTETMLKTVFSEHENFLRTQLNASAGKISDAISAHEQGMLAAMQSNRLNVLRMVGRTWITIVMVSVLMLASCGGVLWWQGQKIVANMQTLSQQEISLAQLNAKTWGVSFRSDSNGKFLVLPAGMKGDTNWTVQNGKRNAVKLVKEP